MPRGDRTGTTGQGPGAGRVMGKAGGRGRQGGLAAGPSGNCVCPRCGKTVPHQRGVPCMQVVCPACGTTMTRQR